jgi:ADP-ribose pyrophosphatase YjhB (NUDIX family)
VGDLPGGRIEYGETFHREVFEETGLNVKIVRILNSWDLIEDDRHISGIIYLCSYESGEVF